MAPTPGGNMAVNVKIAANDSTDSSSLAAISPISKELVIAVVGHAGAGASTAGKRIAALIGLTDYTVIPIKFSELISKLDKTPLPEMQEGANEGISKFGRAEVLQNLGDGIRFKHGSHALAVAAIAEIKARRGTRKPGETKLVFVLDSLKHPDEVKLLRQVYDHSFRLVAVHCDNLRREERLIGARGQTAKYNGVHESTVRQFMARDAKDDVNAHGQRVRDVFHLADFFLDNTLSSPNGSSMAGDIDRFVSLLLDNSLVRPTVGERAIYHAYAAALQSSCLSRQVGAALVGKDGSLIATGANDPPKYGGGIYDEDSKPDNRCFKWNFLGEESSAPFVGCHNDRKKSELYVSISKWMADNLSEVIAKDLVPVSMVLGQDTSIAERERVATSLKTSLSSVDYHLKNMPGIKDAIEYSRAIHAEMAALMSAVRSGAISSGTSLYVTTYPCHNCARHLVAAGVSHVYFIEPYVKSLAYELHSDSIETEPPLTTVAQSGQTKMSVVPFTGVGPRMYEDFFTKRGALKEAGGAYRAGGGGIPLYAVRLHDLNMVEDEAVRLIPAFGSV